MALDYVRFQVMGGPAHSSRLSPPNEGGEQPHGHKKERRALDPQSRRLLDEHAESDVRDPRGQESSALRY